MNIFSTQQTKQQVFQGSIGHRGSRLQAPENTMSSFERAVLDGADGVELDVQLSKDGEFVVLHDDTLDRTSDGQGLAKAMTLEELKELDAGSWFGDKFQGEALPTLSETLDWAEGKTKVDIEVKKGAAKEMTPEMLTRAIKASGAENRVAVSSFDREFIEALEAHDPSLETGVLLSGKPTYKKMAVGATVGLATGFVVGLKATGSVLTAAGLSLVAGLTGSGAGLAAGRHQVRRVAQSTTADAILPHWSVTGKGSIQAAQDRGKSVVPYTVNNERVGAHLVKLGVDGLVTDLPEFFSRYFP